ncbi:hypothetical protein ACHMW6_10975 [Pseudoduganella sp. UC29_106]|uniref:hypothetical protein n=1 Tax=Pseudoduganella sp. UC29_106 TaxID=3374553 RepID=UPI0037564564
MALWRIRYEDRYARPRSIYHELLIQPTKAEAVNIVRQELLQSAYAAGNQQKASDTLSADLAGINVIGIEAVTS